MWIAVPLFGDDIAPRFCAADRALLVEGDEGLERQRLTISLGTASPPERLRRLHDLDVRLLLCGGIDRCFFPLAERLGLCVVWGLAGPADEAVRASLTGRLRSRGSTEGAACGVGPAGPGRGHACGRGGRRLRR